MVNVDPSSLCELPSTLESYAATRRRDKMQNDEWRARQQEGLEKQ